MKARQRRVRWLIIVRPQSCNIHKDNIKFSKTTFKFSNHPVYVCTNGTFIFCRFKIIRTCQFDFIGDAFSETYISICLILVTTLLQSDPNSEMLRGVCTRMCSIIHHQRYLIVSLLLCYTVYQLYN